MPASLDKSTPSHDTRYLQSLVGDALARGCAEVIVAQPTDPVEYLGQYLKRWVVWGSVGLGGCAPGAEGEGSNLDMRCACQPRSCACPHPHRTTHAQLRG